MAKDARTMILGVLDNLLYERNEALGKVIELEAKLAAKWISVEERLPEYGKWCFVVGKFGMVQKVAYARDVGEWRPACEDADSVPDSYVTHWRPLPDPPVQP